MARPLKYSVESRQRAVRLALEQCEEYDSDFEAIRSIAVGAGSAIAKNPFHLGKRTAAFSLVQLATS